jgi:hypothetical protein
MKRFYWLFYKIKKDKNSITVILRTTVTYVNFLLAGLGFVGCFINNTLLSASMFILLLVSMIAKNIVYSKIKLQTIKWSKTIKVETAGSTFSYLNPYKIIAYKLKKV